jgi:DNA adenine methylase
MNNGKVPQRAEHLKRINAPFGYFGSKNKIALQLCNHLPPHSCWVEAFCGSAALTLRKLPAQIEIINDIDNEIVNFFQQLRTNYEELYRLIELTPYAEQELINARKEDKNIDDLERARRFLVQSMMAINGVIGGEKGGFSYSDSYTRNWHDARVSRWNNVPERLKLVVERLKDVRIENKDARKILQRYLNRPATLVYLDPPYLADRVNGYTNEANNQEFHEELLTMANKSKCMIFISGYEHKLYSKMLLKKDGWDKKTIITATKDVRGNSHSRTEVVWMNKHFQNALQLNRIPIKLTPSEIKEKKVNPERR